MAEQTEQLDTSNKFFVGGTGDAIVVQRFHLRLTKAEALNLAAWLVALADDGKKFNKLREAIENT